MKRLVFFTLLLLSRGAFATPFISSVSGSAIYGSTMVLTGAGFGTKPIRDKQLFYANFKSDVNPSTWSFITSWTDSANTQFKTTDCGEGSGCLGETTGWEASNKITAGINHGALSAGDKFSISWIWKSDTGNVSDTMNWKTYRWWCGLGNKNNTYGGQQIDGGFLNYVENSPPDAFPPLSGVDRFYTNDIEPIPSSYQQIEMLFQLNSVPDAQNGKWTLVQAGNQEINTTTWRSNTSAATTANGYYSLFYPVHMVLTGSGTPISSGHYFRIDNIVADPSWCAVWVTTASTNIATATKYWLPIIDWTNGTVRVVWANDKFATGTTVYMYARANDGTVNSSGKAITVSGTSGTPPPTLTGISITSGTASGGTTTVLTGTNFSSGFTVQFGTVPASITTFTSSTRGTAVSPGHAAGTVDVTFLNLDGQSSVVASTFTYIGVPVVSVISPSTATPLGTTPVLLGGTFFAAGSTVQVGTMSASSVSVITSTAIRFTAPGMSPGTYSVKVTTGSIFGSATGLTYAQPPSGLTPVPGTAFRMGGSTITISGSDFQSGFTLKVGTTSAQAVTFTNAALGNFVTPSLPAGAYTVTLTNPDGQTATYVNFSMTEPPNPSAPTNMGTVLFIIIHP